MLLSLFELGISLALVFLRDNFTARAVSPPAEVAAPATIHPTLAKQTGHIASPLVRAAKLNHHAASVGMTSGAL